MKQVYEHKLQIGTTTITMSGDFYPLTAGITHSGIVIWTEAEGGCGAPATHRRFHTVENHIDVPEGAIYITTLYHNSVIKHIYELED